ncbi:hypothetical protein FE257_009207 [Aspergillus nanangensis]|uniref:Uncharacterized protein n=1 Tax=Aspergillus nanangensis TaxID=2582783 RepID=A0AAD4CMB9_ASPNN|nr:hypothetical protein FE257_009207 [Aspergillus nanangensis]
MDGPQTAVDKIRRFSEKRQKAERTYDEQPISPAALQVYNQKLDDTLRELQDQVRRQEDDLRTLRAANAVDLSKIDTSPWARVSEVRRAKNAYDSLLKADANLPKPESSLPPLLAVEETSHLVKESKAYVSMTAARLSTNRERLNIEEANFRSAQVIRDGLQNRIKDIRTEKTSKSKKTPSQLARDFIGDQELKKDEIDMSIEDLKKTLHDFVDNTLAPMLAAEDLGGPTVGDVEDISDAVLERGYTSHGKPKKPKATETSHDNTQRRIDELLPRQNDGRENERPHSTNKREAAAAEMHDLLDKLFEAGASYIDLPSESAASRFLVRVKVAQFHPRDARRLRMIDFGRSLND